MKRRFRFLVDRTMVGTVLTGLAGQAVLIVSGVIVARNLGAHDRGELALIIAIAVSTSFIVSLGIPTAVAFTVAQDPHAVRGALVAIRKWALGQLAVAFIVTSIALMLALSGADGDMYVVAPCVALAAMASIVLMYGLGILQGQSRFVAFNLLRLAPAVGYMVGVVAIILTDHGSVESFALAWALTYCAAAAAVTIALVSIVRRAPEQPVASRELVVYGVKAQIGTASPLENFQIDQLLVGAIAGPTQLGLYVIGTAFTNLPRFIAQSLGMVVFPRVAALLGMGARDVVKQALYATVLLSGGTVIVLELLVGWLVPFFFGSQFDGSVPVARILLIASFCFSLRRVLSDALRGANRPLAGTIAEIVAWVLFAITIVPLTLTWDARGAAVAVALAAAASLAYIANAARRTSLRLPGQEESLTGPPAPNPT